MTQNETENSKTGAAAENEPEKNKKPKDYEKSIEFVDRVLKNASNEKYLNDLRILKRSFGRSLMDIEYDDNRNAFVSFLKMGADYRHNGWSRRLAAEFFTTQLISETESDHNGTSRFEEELRKLYDSDHNGAKKRIELLFSTDLDETGCLENMLSRLVKLAKDSDASFKNIDFARLLYDIEHWNLDNIYGSRNGWAYTIVKPLDFKIKGE